jgi:hypothetical protein
MKPGVVRTLSLAALLCGCTPRIAFDPARAGALTSIAILTADAPDDVSVEDAYKPEGVELDCGPLCVFVVPFHLLAAGVNEVVDEGREDRLNELLSERRFSGRELLMRSLRENLEGQGYEVSTVIASRSDADSLLLEPATLNADAVVDIVIETFGYYNDTGVLRPRLFVDVTLIRTRDSRVLMRETIKYNPEPFSPGYDDSIWLEAADQFPDFGALEANPDGAVAGLVEAVHRVAVTISGLLER